MGIFGPPIWRRDASCVCRKSPPLIWRDLVDAVTHACRRFGVVWALGMGFPITWKGEGRVQSAKAYWIWGPSKYSTVSSTVFQYRPPETCMRKRVVSCVRKHMVGVNWLVSLKVERSTYVDSSTPSANLLDDWRARDRVKESAEQAYWLEKGAPSSSACASVLCSTVWSRPFVVWAGDVEGCGLLADGQT